MIETLHFLSADVIGISAAGPTALALPSDILAGFASSSWSRLLQQRGMKKSSGARAFYLDALKE